MPRAPGASRYSLLYARLSPPGGGLYCRVDETSSQNCVAISAIDFSGRAAAVFSMINNSSVESSVETATTAAAVVARSLSVNKPKGVGGIAGEGGPLVAIGIAVIRVVADVDYIKFGCPSGRRFLSEALA